MASRNYTDKTLKILFAASGNRCAFPGCSRNLVAAESDVTAEMVLGEIAHIVGLTPKRGLSGILCIGRDLSVRS